MTVEVPVLKRYNADKKIGVEAQDEADQRGKERPDKQDLD